MKKIKSNCKILIVEDDEDFLEILKIKFESEGFSVLACKSGMDAINLLQEKKPDLILSDVLMPEMSGIEMAKRIKELNSDIPIILMTNLKDVDYVKEIEKNKNFDYLIKSETRIGEIVEKVKNKLQ